MASILVYIELKQNKISAASLAALNEGRRVASGLGATLCALLPCAAPPTYGSDDIIAVLSRYGADKVILITHSSLAAPPLFATHQRAVLAACERIKPRLIIFPDTCAGQDIAPRLAAVLTAPYWAHAWFEADGSDFSLVRHIFRRNYQLRETLCETGDIVVITLSRGGTVQIMGDDEAEVIVLHIPGIDFPEVAIRGSRELPLRELPFARLVVLGGAGLVDKESFTVVERLAQALGGASAASPRACNMGLADPLCQVGLDGSCISADVLLTLGSAGSEELLAGLAPHTIVMAVGDDDQAPGLFAARYALRAVPSTAAAELLAQVEKGQN